MTDAGKDRGFYHGGRIGSWLGLAGSIAGTAIIFFGANAARPWSGYFWLALCLAGPLFIAGGWIAGKFAGSYVGELMFSGHREQVGFLAGCVLGALLGEMLSGRPGLWVIGLCIGAGVGRSLCQPRP